MASLSTRSIPGEGGPASIVELGVTSVVRLANGHHLERATTPLQDRTICRRDRVAKDVDIVVSNPSLPARPW
jgi:hypothetical protein